MFERFTDRARRIVVLANTEAALCGHGYIDTGHILAGMIHEGEGVAYRVLESFGLTLDDVHQQLIDLFGEGDTTSDTRFRPMMWHAKKLMELSMREALNLGHNYIGTEHLLLAMIKQTDDQGGASRILTALGVDDLNEVRRRVLDILAAPPAIETERAEVLALVNSRHTTKADLIAAFEQIVPTLDSGKLFLIKAVLSK